MVFQKLSIIYVSALFFFLFNGHTNSQTEQLIRIKGTITNIQKKPIGEATVTLINQPNLSTKTKKDGSFLLEFIPTSLLTQPNISIRPTISFTSEALFFTQKIPGMVNISFYSISGVMISSPFKGRLETGSYRFSMPKSISQAVYIIGIRLNNETHYYKMTSLFTHSHIPFHSDQIRSTVQTYSGMRGESNTDTYVAIDTLVVTKANFEIKKIAIDTYTTTVSTQLVSKAMMIPAYEPGFWNDNSTTKSKNNCYNYGNNKKTNTFAQPGRASGKKYKKCNCPEVTKAALRDGLDSCESITQPLPPGKARIALAVVPTGRDYHWWREDRDKKWSHKPGKGRATKYDNSKKLISNPEKADRGRYKTFCGYFFVDSDSVQGEGHENIRTTTVENELNSEKEEIRESSMLVTLMVNSGQEDPHYYVKSEKMQAHVLSAIQRVHQYGSYARESIEPSLLGYRGILIDIFSDNSRTPEEYIIYNNHIEYVPLRGARKVVTIDLPFSIEKLLVDAALAQKVIDQGLVDEEFAFFD